MYESERFLIFNFFDYFIFILVFIYFLDDRVKSNRLIDCPKERNHIKVGRHRSCENLSIKYFRNKENTATSKTCSTAEKENADAKKGMNSHTAALNLQSSGHRGFPQVTSTTGNSSECPWFMSPHQMPPTAPARQHKRPAPQPGVLTGVGMSGSANGILIQPTPLPVTQQAAGTISQSTNITSTVGPPITHPHPPVQNLLGHNNINSSQQVIPQTQLPPHNTNMVNKFTLIFYNKYNN